MWQTLQFFYHFFELFPRPKQQLRAYFNDLLLNSIFYTEHCLTKIRIPNLFVILTKYLVIFIYICIEFTYNDKSDRCVKHIIEISCKYYAKFCKVGWLYPCRNELMVKHMLFFLEKELCLDIVSLWKTIILTFWLMLVISKFHSLNKIFSHFDVFPFSSELILDIKWATSGLAWATICVSGCEWR